MASNNYWMKLWFDILRDPKMGMLPDRLWRRVIELFLLAGQNGEDGLLPDIPTIAWQLNKPVTAIVTDLQKIAEVGIVQEIQEGEWVVTNFKKRNEPVDSTKRMKDFRMRERYEKSDENVTEMKRECDATVTMRNQEEQKNRRTELTDKNNDSLWLSFSSAFQELTGIEPKPTKPVIEMLDKFQTSGITAHEYRTAISEMLAGGYSCPTMKSPETWVMNNRNGNKRKPKVDDTKGSYEYFKQLRKGAKNANQR